MIPHTVAAAATPPKSPLCYGVSLCYDDSRCNGVSPCYDVSLCYGVMVSACVMELGRVMVFPVFWC